MPFSYNRRPGDVAFRKVNISVSGTGKFEEFQKPNQTVNYPDTGCVLEVLREDGSTELFYEGTTANVTYMANSANTIRMGRVPLDRVWLRKAGESAMAYKLPNVPPDGDGLITLRIPGGTADVELYGDKYFEKIYTLIKK